MNLDELVTKLELISDDPAIEQLARVLLSWKSDDSTITELRRDIELFIGNRWVGREEEHDQMYSLWSEFRDHEIDMIGGMTMNERLYSFGLFERFDSSADEESQLVVYRKLLASP